MSLLLALVVTATAVGAPPAPVTAVPTGATPSAPAGEPELPKDFAPAAVPTIVAGAKACVGVTRDQAGIPARFAGWTDTVAGMSADDVRGMKAAGGRMLTRDNVRVALNPPPRAICMIAATITDTFDRTALQTGLSQATGVAVAVNAAPATLPSGEIMSVEVGDRMALIFIADPKVAKANDFSDEHASDTLPSAPSTPNDKGQ